MVETVSGKSGHWAAQNERGNGQVLKLTAWIVRRLPIVSVKIITFVVCLYFYLTSPKQRRNIRGYQQRLRQTFPQAGLPENAAVLRQFIAFGESVADRFAVWQNKITYSDLVLHDPDDVYAQMHNPTERGQIFICSHLGNVEICRALVGSGHHGDFKLNVLVHSKHAEQFNRALKQAGANDIALIQVSDLDAAKMLELANKLDKGEWLAVAADRTPVRGEKTVSAPFLGGSAEFPQGVWLLALLLRAKTNTIFVLKRQGRYHLMLQKFTDIPGAKRGGRDEWINGNVCRYAQCLAEHAAQAPLQWFNFYDFWNEYE